LVARGADNGGVSAADALMIGDRAVDITSAQANGIASMGVLWGFGDRAEIEGAAPDMIAEAPGDLVGMIS
jgi:phosphoglycolate phosphatase